jgi:hypothetical protein
MALHLGCIVEGHGEVHAVPVLLRRIQCELAPGLDLRIQQPWRIGRYKLVKPGELEHAVERLARQIPSPRFALVLIDADDDCPAQLGPSLLARARAVRPDIPLCVVLAKHEFEAWFLASLESLCGRRGLPDQIDELPDPEAIGDAKGYLTRLMPGTCAYSETGDQPALADVFDMQTARKRSDSFDKLFREMAGLFAEMSQGGRQDDAQSG